VPPSPSAPIEAAANTPIAAAMSMSVTETVAEGNESDASDWSQESDDDV
jgi:hypothetical protein